ncbi:MAG: hypothetical protein ACI4C4_05220 [Lachnospiraceae bacterium]
MNRCKSSKESEDGEKRTHKIFSKDQPLSEILQIAEIYARTEVVYIKIDDINKKLLKRKIKKEYGVKDGKYGVLDIVDTNKGLLLISDDMMLGEKLLSINE